MRHLLLLVLFCCGTTLSGQYYISRIHKKVRIGDTTQLHQLILLDYTKLLGTALALNNGKIYFRSRSAHEVSEIPLHEMRFLGLFRLSEGKATRNGAGPGFADLTYERTALPYHDDGRIKVINLLYAVAEWNVNEKVQLGLGIAGPLGVLMTGRVRHTLIDDVHIGVSAQALYPPLTQLNREFILVGDLTGLLTVGNERRFLNVGSGILFNTDDGVTNIPVHRMGIGGRISRKVHLYGEALMLLERENSFRGDRQLSVAPSVSVSVGARRHRWRFGVFTVLLDEDSFVPPPLPYVAYSYYW